MLPVGAIVGQVGPIFHNLLSIFAESRNRQKQKTNHKIWWVGPSQPFDCNAAHQALNKDRMLGTRISLKGEDGDNPKYRTFCKIES